jgi:cardiolipin synthase
MSTVTIAFPVTRIKVRLQLYKGQAWSVAEHCILEALVREQRSVDELLSGFRLPRSMVEEALMRLMRVGWVEPLVTADGRALFRATAIGRAAAAHDEEALPSALRPAQRERWQLFERVTGHVFRVNDLNHIRRQELNHQPHASRIREVPATLEEGHYRPEELAEIALEEDEWLVGVEPTGEFAANRLALVEVVDGEITGLPADRDIEDLRAAIRQAAERAPGSRRESRYRPASARPPETHRKHPIHFRPDDLILGGEAHSQTLRQILDTACTRVIIHSTFLSERRFLEWWDPMVKAMREREVQIDILWGQDSREDADGEPQPPPAELAAQSLLLRPEVMAWQDRLRIHPTSTRSHAKVIVADPRQPGRWEVIVGSCNWLDTPFQKVEASVRLRDAGIVRDVIVGLMALVHGGGPWPELATELHHMAERLRTEASADGANGVACLVSNAGHNNHLLRARDQLRDKLLLVSHRLGSHYDCGALLPLAAACGSTRVDARLLYSKNEHGDGHTPSQLEREARGKGISLKLVKDPRLHAKLLAWDDDDIVLTSLNWMSCDAGFSSLLQELGVAITAPGAARHLMDLFDRQLHGTHVRGARNRR